MTHTRKAAHAHRSEAACVRVAEGGGGRPGEVDALASDPPGADGTCAGLTLHTFSAWAKVGGSRGRAM